MRNILQQNVIRHVIYFILRYFPHKNKMKTLRKEGVCNEERKIQKDVGIFLVIFPVGSKVFASCKLVKFFKHSFSLFLNNVHTYAWVLVCKAGYCFVLMSCVENKTERLKFLDIVWFVYASHYVLKQVCILSWKKENKIVRFFFLKIK